MATTCIIERDDKKRVRKVKTLSGGKSTLFDKIASTPLMENRERALSIFKTVYSSKFKKLFGDWTVNTPINRKAFNQVKKIFSLYLNNIVMLFLKKHQRWTILLWLVG